MIILVTLFAICYVAYSFWIIDFMTSRFSSVSFCLLVSLFCIAMPLAILAQVLTSIGVLK